MNRILSRLALLSSAVLLLLMGGGCSKINSELKDIRSEVASLSDRVSYIEKSQITTLTFRIDSLKDEVSKLQRADKVKDGDISSLQKAASAVSGDFASLKEEVSALEDTTGKLTLRIEEIQKRVAEMDSDLATVRSGIEELKKKTEIAVVTVSLNHIPRNLAGEETAIYTRTGVEISGSVTMRFNVQPSRFADSLALHPEKLLYARGLVPSASDGGVKDFEVLGATAKDSVLSVTVSTSSLDKAFILGQTSAAVAVGVNFGGRKTLTGFVKIVPEIREEKLVTYLLNNFDLDGDGRVEADKITSIDLSAYGLSTVDDIISCLPALEVLSCYNNSLSSIDLSHNPKLTTLVAFSNKSLTTLDVSNNPALTMLNISGDAVTALDLSKNPALTTLEVSGTALVELNLSNNKFLSSLGLSALKTLKTLNVSNTALTSLDLAGKTALSSLDVSGCSLLKSLDISGTLVGSVDISASTALTSLNVLGSKITELDITKNTALTSLGIAKTVKLIVVTGLESSIYQTGQYVSLDGVTGVLFGEISTLISTAETATPCILGRSWCSALGTGWSLPTPDELQIIYDNISEINSTLSAIGATALGAERYWSSFTSSASGTYMDFSDGTQGSAGADNSYKVRAIRKL